MARLKIKKGTDIDLLKKFIDNEDNNLWVSGFSNDDIVYPWDSDISIEGRKFVLKGGVTPGGGREGSCTCSYNYDYIVENCTFDTDDIDDVELFNQIFEDF